MTLYFDVAVAIIRTSVPFVLAGLAGVVVVILCNREASRR